MGPSLLMATRLDVDGWHGLVGYTDQVTRTGYYHWCREEHLRSTADTIPLTGVAT